MRTNEIEKWKTHFKNIFQIQRNKMFFANDARFPFTYSHICSVIVCVMFCLRRVETESRFVHSLYASLPWCCVQLDFYSAVRYAKICVNATAVRSWYDLGRILSSSHKNSSKISGRTCQDPMKSWLDLAAYLVPRSCHNLGNILSRVFRSYHVSVCFCRPGWVLSKQTQMRKE